MNARTIGTALAGLALVAAGWAGWGWGGVALAAGGIVMWMLLHFNRLVKVLQRASKRPVGFCDSAVMLNAKLQPGVNLLHVIALTRALGEALSPKDEEPEVFRWTDAGASSVTCEFREGRLVRWQLLRPGEGAEGAAVERSAAER
ncbi:MAG TPA: glycerate kinase [Ramlibacter sp.]|uniref:glycerate kinase n=1 Tax=Ramlibacter sp. TaxID=1917967 RepID=UPI002C5F7F4A|nr:glycerate kinase [Ramlibacter sp.]HVZ42711.1 glycerate kinase [Ramlibacter sp.]